MRTALISHPSCRLHDTGDGHPENARRLYAIEDRLVASGLSDVLYHYEAPRASDEHLLRVHTRQHLETVAVPIPGDGHARLDPDTVVSSASHEAARRAAGALVHAVDLVLSGEVKTAFCCVRPPGHHAESDRAMGFCLFNNIAVGAAHALAEHGLQRVAIVDFDVHHGNGTEEIFLDEERVLFCSTFEYPFYPYTPLLENARNRICVPLDATAGSDEFRAAVTEQWLPALRAFKPDLMFVSAGFDAHRDDDMSHVSLTDGDFRWVSDRLADVAQASAKGRIVSALEGGYERASLARCAEIHLRVLMGIS